MCVILDANCIGKYNKDPADEDMKPVQQWLERKNGKIVYSDTEKFRKEWDSGGGYELRRQLQRRNKLKLMSVQDVQQKENELKDKIKSNDAHIVALALVAQVKVLVSNDSKLIEDFKEHVSQGKVYKTKGHRHLLTKDTCP